MGGYKRREKIPISDKSYGIVVLPEPVYKYPKGHPCYGCLFTLEASKPSCMTGSYPDTENCINAFYNKIRKRQRYEHEQLARDISY